jgi:hypothetical protein
LGYTRPTGALLNGSEAPPAAKRPTDEFRATRRNVRGKLASPKTFGGKNGGALASEAGLSEVEK